MTAAESTPRPRLLVVDDEPAICELIREIAIGVGFDVDTASDAATIDAQLGAGHQVTVLDLSLAGDDGVSAMRTLSARTPGAAVIVASGAPERVLASAQRVAGMYGLRVLGACAKPLSVASLQTILRTAFDSAGTPLPQVMTPGEIADRVQEMRIDDVTLAYQPVIDLRNGEVVSAETFSRWRSGLGDSMDPNTFVPEMERVGSSGELLSHVARGAAADRIAVPALTRLPTVAINVSIRDFENLDMPAMLHSTLTAAAPASAWTLEITETATVGSAALALDVITRLSLNEFRLAIDDFGTGQSNLERLRWYPFSELKIDRSFLTDDSSGSGSDWIIVRNAVTMAQQLGLEVVAEGVEDTRTLRRLRDLGCDRAQGYLISPPVPAAEFGERCEAWSQMAATLY